MGDTFGLAAEIEPLDGLLGERRREALEQAHARRRVGKLAADIKVVGVDRIAFRVFAVRHHRVALLDAR